MSKDTKTDLGLVCEHADLLRARLGRASERASPVDAVLRAAREGGDLAGELSRLSESLTALGGRGLAEYADGIHRVGAKDARVAGVGLPRPASALYGCPDGRCARTWEPTPAEDVPVCRVSGSSLRPPRGR